MIDLKGLKLPLNQQEILECLLSRWSIEEIRKELKLGRETIKEEILNLCSRFEVQEDDGNNRYNHHMICNRFLKIFTAK